MSDDKSQIEQFKDLCCEFLRRSSFLLNDNAQIKSHIKKKIGNLSKKVKHAIDLSQSKTLKKKVKEASSTQIDGNYPTHSQFYCLETDPEELDSVNSLRSTVESECKTFDTVYDKESHKMKVYVSLLRNKRVAPLVSKQPLLKPITAREFKLRTKSFMRLVTSHLCSQLVELASKLIDLVKLPTQDSLDKFNNALGHSFLKVRDRERRKRSIQCFLYSICAIAVELGADSELLGFDRRFKDYSAPRTHKWIQVDGCVQIDGILVLLEFSSHNKNGEANPLDELMMRGYKSKIKVNKNIQKALIIGISFKGKEHMTLSTKRMTTRLARFPITNGSVLLRYEGVTLEASENLTEAF